MCPRIFPAWQDDHPDYDDDDDYDNDDDDDIILKCITSVSLSRKVTIFPLSLTPPLPLKSRNFVVSPVSRHF